MFNKHSQIKTETGSLNLLIVDVQDDCIAFIDLNHSVAKRRARTDSAKRPTPNRHRYGRRRRHRTDDDSHGCTRDTPPFPRSGGRQPEVAPTGTNPRAFEGADGSKARPADRTRRRRAEAAGGGHQIPRATCPQEELNPKRLAATR